MNATTLYENFVTDFDLTSLPEEEKNSSVTKIGEVVQKEYLLSVFDTLGKDKFDALQASANMGEEFYATTLKHLLPNYEKLWKDAYQKILVSFKNEKPVVLN